MEDTTKHKNNKKSKSISEQPKTYKKSKYTSFDCTAYRYFELQAQDFFKELSGHLRNIQSGLEGPCEESHEANAMNDYKLEFSVRQAASDLNWGVNENTLQSEEATDREKVRENLSELRGELEKIEARQDKEKNLVFFLAKVLSHVKQKFERIEWKSEGTQTSIGSTEETDSTKYTDVTTKHRQRIEELKKDSKYALNQMEDQFSMQLGKYVDWGLFKLQIKSDTPFMKNDTVYDEYTRGKYLKYI